MRVVVIGAGGQLGSDLMRVFADLRPAGLTRHLCDIEEPAAISAMLRHHKPDVVINTAAYHNVDVCEARPDRAMAVNALAVDGLAAQCALAGAALAHVSTDYVFDGAATVPYVESDRPRPLNAYGVSKLAGELLIGRSLERAYIIRTGGLYGTRGSSAKGLAFVERVLASVGSGSPMRVVTDVVSSPSYTVHVARAIRSIVEGGAFGTYHVTNAGACSWYEFASEVVRASGATLAIEPTTASAFPSLARRPAFSALAGRALETAGLPPMPAWQDGLAAYLAERAR